jgi:hypothetical protein
MIIMNLDTVSLEAGVGLNVSSGIKLEDEKPRD